MNKTDQELIKLLPNLVELRDSATEWKQRAKSAEEEVSFLREQNTVLIKMLSEKLN